MYIYVKSLYINNDNILFLFLTISEIISIGNMTVISILNVSQNAKTNYLAHFASNQNMPSFFAQMIQSKSCLE